MILLKLPPHLKFLMKNFNQIQNFFFVSQEQYYKNTATQTLLAIPLKISIVLLEVWVEATIDGTELLFLGGQFFK